MSQVLEYSTSEDVTDRTENTAEIPKEHIKRSLAKTISWRALGTITTVVVSYFITGTLTLAFSIGAIELVSKLILYFFHERAWNRITWGK